MIIDKTKFMELMDQKAGGNYNEFARALGVDVAHLHRVVNKNKGLGIKFYSAFSKYCLENNLDVDEYIFLR